VFILENLKIETIKKNSLEKSKEFYFT